jgi:GNAT superfamily N-acetyltransferase
VTSVPPEPSDLPERWSARVPADEDVLPLAELVAAHRRAVRGTASVQTDSIAAAVIGTGSWTRRQLLVESPEGEVAAWVAVHDRAGGRTMVDLTVAPDIDDADALAAVLLDWACDAAVETARLRELDETQLDVMVYADDASQQRWLAAAGYERTRTWLQMSRPVDDADTLPEPRTGVVVRRVRKHGNGLPVAGDIQVVHQMLEESFADHFNSYRESFPEFLQRLREDPGHRWDHWWIAEVDGPEGPQPGGALVSSVLVADEQGVEGSYVDYIGVHRRARGRGVAKALLHTVIRDAQRRGRNRVDLEVDADSPTHADRLYTSMGWTTKYCTESWHATCST